MDSVQPTTASYFLHLGTATTIASTACLLSMRGYGFATICTAAALGGVYAWRTATVIQSLKDQQGSPEKVDQIVRAFRFATLGLGAVSLGYGLNSLAMGVRPFTTPRSSWSLLSSLYGAQYITWSFAYALPLGITLLSYALKTLRHHAAITAQLQEWSRQGMLSLVNRSLEWMHGKGYDVISRSQALSWAGVDLRTAHVDIDQLQYLSTSELVTVLQHHHASLDMKAVFENYLPKLPISMFYDENTPEELRQKFTAWIESKSYHQLTVIFETIPNQLRILLTLLDDNGRTQQDLKGFLIDRLAWCAKPPVTDATLETVDPDTILNRFLAGIRDRQFIRRLSLPQEQLKRFQEWEEGFLKTAEKYQELLWDRKVASGPLQASTGPDVVSILMQKGLNHAVCEQVIAECCLTPLGDPWKTLQVHLGMMGIRTPEQLYQRGILKFVSDDREAEERLNALGEVTQRLVEFLKKPQSAGADAPSPSSIETRSTVKKVVGVTRLIFEEVLQLALYWIFIKDLSREMKAFSAVAMLLPLAQKKWKFELREGANYLPSFSDFCGQQYNQLFFNTLWLSDTTWRGRFKRLWSSIRS